MFLPAGYRPAQAFVRAGERAGERWGDAELLPSRTVGLAVLAGRFVLARGWLCVPVAALCPRARLALRFCRGAYPRFASGFAFLSRRFALARVWLCGSVAALPLRTVGIAFLSRRFSSVHACCLSCDKQDGLRYAPFLFRRVEIAIRAFSRCQCGYLPLLVHFGFGRFFMAIPTGDRGRGKRSYEGYGVRGTGLAARRLCVFAQSHWPCEFFRGEYVGAARPKPAPKSLRLSGLSSRCGGVVLVRVRGHCPPTSLITGFCPRPHTGSAP